MPTALPRILHVMRSPVGGLFRHVLDLSSEQISRGYEVGLVCDRDTGGEAAAARLEAIASNFALGVHRFPIPRAPRLGDVFALRRTLSLIASFKPAIVHGHGAKGGAYARLAAARLVNKGGPAAFYTPHGGALHYDPASAQGRLFFAFERYAQRWTKAILFESHYGLGVYRRKIGEPACPVAVIHNGLRPDEFEPAIPDEDAADVLFIGEMRDLKGVSVLLDALAILKAEERPVSALLVGGGPDKARFREQAKSLRLMGHVTFVGAMPARQAFTRARAIVVPSLNESLPYVVLEAAAAGLPMIATTVGGIPEIFAGEAHRLVAPGNPCSLADAIADMVSDRPRARAEAEGLRQSIASRFSVTAMTDGVMEAYGVGERLSHNATQNMARAI